jgi:serine/threonine protein kinase
MSYCLNPNCQKPSNNLANAKFCLNCGTNLLLGDRYRPTKSIAREGFGIALLAEDEFKPSKPPCLIKQFFPLEHNNDPKAVELFHEEAVRLEQLGKHPQIPELLAHFESGDRLYIVQEFIEGKNLAQELTQTSVFREHQIWSLLQDLLPVLQFIHNGQVIHRDIKPDNIIRRDSDGKLVLVDFGAAKYVTAAAFGQTGTKIGSAGYVAPEQTFGKAVFASDIYSLGVTCIHLLTGIEPFDLYDTSESKFVWKNYLIDNPVSEELTQILNKMIELSLNKRYKSADEVLQDLNSAIDKQAIPPQPLSDLANPSAQSTANSLLQSSKTWLTVALLLIVGLRLYQHWHFTNSNLESNTDRIGAEHNNYAH